TEGVSCNSDDCSACCSPCADLKTEETTLPSGPCLMAKVSVATRWPVVKTPKEPESTTSAVDFSLSFADSGIVTRTLEHRTRASLIEASRTVFNRMLLKREPDSVLR